MKIDGEACIRSSKILKDFFYEKFKLNVFVNIDAIVIKSN